MPIVFPRACIDVLTLFTTHIIYLKSSRRAGKFIREWEVGRFYTNCSQRRTTRGFSISCKSPSSSCFISFGILHDTKRHEQPCISIHQILLFVLHSALSERTGLYEDLMEAGEKKRLSTALLFWDETYVTKRTNRRADDYRRRRRQQAPYEA